MILLILINSMVNAACITSTPSLVAANPDETVQSTFIPCAGYVWEPVEWNSVDGAATSYTISKLIQYTPDNTLKYRSGNMASTSFNQGPDPTWPKWNTKFSFPLKKSDYSLPNNLKNSVCARHSNGAFVIKGMYSAFPNPFLNPNSPTLAEIDNYHHHVLMHLRRAFGIKTPTFLSGPYHLRAHWYSINNLLDPACTPPSSNPGPGRCGVRIPALKSTKKISSHCGDGIINPAYTSDQMRTEQLSKLDMQEGYVCSDEPNFCKSIKQTTDKRGTSNGIMGSNKDWKITNQFQNALCYFLGDGLDKNGNFQAHNGPIAGRPNFAVHINDKNTKVHWGGKRSG